MKEKLITKSLRTRVVGKFIPSVFDKDIIQTELDQFLKEKFGKLQPVYDDDEDFTTVRDPFDHLELALPKKGRDRIGEFHHDLGGVGSILFIWSNIVPVEVKLSSGKTKSEKFLEIGDNDVVLIVNHEAKHRMPVGKVRQSTNRWLYRRYVGLPKKEKK